ncbi:hypothetical protein DFH27DRAFT_235781 [Peziza echinospora]|nr:hypothetical protein DFH27DRAFT_235781 [Peziza echinospora]
MAGDHVVPLPKQVLGQHCSVMVNGTLYTFSETCFQSLRMEKGAEWQEIPMIFGTKGAVCVHTNKGTPEEALFVMGGTSTNTTMVPETGYMGVQKFTFGTQQWENVQTPDPIAFNLTNHGATFLKATNEIMMFSGARWPQEETPSAMAFLIKAAAPYTITAISTELAPPLLAPILVPFGDDTGLIVGGGAENTALYTYSPTKGWANLEAKLSKGLSPRLAGATIVDADDGSKMLLTFDISSEPVRFERVKVQKASVDFRGPGSPGDNSFGGKKGLTEFNWPPYDGKFAPARVETAFSFAQNGSTLVFSGGNNQDPLCVFDIRQNHWNDTTRVFNDETTDDSGNLPDDGGDQRTITDGENSTPSPTETAVLGPIKRNGLNNVQKIFIALGSLLAAAFLLGAILFLLKKRKNKIKLSLNRSGTGKSKMSFQDRGLRYSKEAGGRFGPGDKNFMDEVPVPRPQPGTRQIQENQEQRGSGWSRYFSGNSATNLVALPSRSYSNATIGSSVYGTNVSTRYPYESGVSLASDNRSQGLVLDLPGATLNVSAASFKNSRNSRRSSVSSLGGASSFFSSGVPESIAERGIWSPVGNGAAATVTMPSMPTEVSGVRNSPRGWGVLTMESRGSSVYPESAVTVYPEEWDNAGEPGRGDDNRRPLRTPGDVSWLSLNKN